MNLLHMRYAVEVAETKSINKAAEALLVGAPALSRAIKELESNLGVTLFERSAKGMFLTPNGEIFVSYAKNILKQVDDVEDVFKKNSKSMARFSISVPRASYIGEAFSSFVSKLDRTKETELVYIEANAYRVVQSVLKENYNLGIVRYALKHEAYYKALMHDKGLDGEVITEFEYELLMNKDCPLAKKDEIAFKDLNGYMEISHADSYSPSLPLAVVKKSERPEPVGNKLYVFERASQFEVLSKDSNCYMWVSSVPQELLDRWGLVQRKCVDEIRRYKDVLIHREDYKLSALDKNFIDELISIKRSLFE